MRVFVTGGTGFVGSHAVEALVAAGHEVRLLARDKAKVEAVLGPRGLDPGALDVVYGDMLDAASVAAGLDGCDAAIHAAASVAVTGSDNERLVAINVDGAHHVVGQAVERGLDPVVYVSTTAVFVPPTQPVITVDSPLASPRNPYGRSKVEAERFARGLQEQGKPVTIVYPGGVFGPDQPTLDAAMEGVKGAIEQAWPMTKGGVTIVDVRDLGQIIARTIAAGQGPRRFMAGGRYLSWPEFADLTDRLTGVRCRRMVVPGPVLLGIGWALDQAKKVKRFDYPLTLDAAEFMVRMVPTDDQPTLDALGMTYRPIDETVADALRWLAATGQLRPKAAGRLAPTH